jgi:hypothetical protein
LHVLSTPPAFVLSQDQTLRECIWTSGKAGLSTQKVTVLRRFNHWSIRAGCFFARCTKGISFTLRQMPKRGRELYMALTFGTLLSSQGADAHRQDPFGPIGGNPRYVTRSVPHRQTRPAPPGLPLGRGDSRGVSCLVLGGTPARLHPTRIASMRPVRGSVTRTSATLVSRALQCKFPVKRHAAQCLPGLRGRGSTLRRSPPQGANM